MRRCLVEVLLNCETKIEWWIEIFDILSIIRPYLVLLGLCGLDYLHTDERTGTTKNKKKKTIFKLTIFSTETFSEKNQIVSKT